MKKLLFACMVLASVFVLTGCSDSPRKVTQKWANAIVDGDAKTANEYSTADMAVINAGFIAEIQKSEKSKQEFKDLIKEKLDNAEEEIDGDTAYVGPKDMKKEKKLILKKVDGKWKVGGK